MDHIFMKEALLMARRGASKGEVPIGVVIVKNNKIIAKAHNRKEELIDSTAHAEILAIRKASKAIGHWWLEGCTLYTTLEPCSMCAGAILNSRIERVVIATGDNRMGACGGSIDLSNIDGFNHSFDVTFGVYKKESQELLSNFFKALRDSKQEL